MSGYCRMLNGSEYHVGESLPPIDCLRCGVCCTRYQPRLTPEEIETIAVGLSLSTNDFLSRYVQQTTVGYLLRQSEGGCVFLTWDEDGARASCSIYAFRPESCRDWVPSLSRRECREGLLKLKARGKIMLPEELYTSLEAINRFYSAIASF